MRRASKLIMDFAKSWGFPVDPLQVAAYLQGDSPFIFSDPQYTTAMHAWEKLSRGISNDTVLSLFKLVCVLNTVLASEACVERLFSREKRIHKKDRASLAKETVDDLLMLSHSFEEWQALRRRSLPE